MKIFNLLLSLGIFGAAEGNVQRRSEEDSCQAICAIANCKAPNAQELCPNACRQADPAGNSILPIHLASPDVCQLEDFGIGDFGIVADVSRSVYGHWQDEKLFMKKLIQRIGVSAQEGRVAVTTYSNKAELKIKFSDHTTNQAFEEALDGISYVGSSVRIDLGLNAALNQMFQESNGMRSGVHKTLILLTDGQQPRVDFDDYRKKFDAAGIRVLLIGIGNVRQRDVRHLVADDDDIYIAADFDDLYGDNFIESITLCGEFIQKTVCRDKNLACPTYMKYGYARFCNQGWFTGMDGRFGCIKSCKQC